MCRIFIGECTRISTCGVVKKAEMGRRSLGSEEVTRKASGDTELAAGIPQSNTELEQGSQSFIHLH